MIVPMKKVTLIVLASEKQAALKDLARLGVLDIESSTVLHSDSDELESLRESRNLLHKGLFLLDKAPGNDKKTKEYTPDKARSLAMETCDLADRIHELQEEELRLRAASDRISPWGDFKPQDIPELREAGMNVRLFEIDVKKLRSLSPEIDYILVNKDKHVARIACVAAPEGPLADLHEFKLPEQSLSEIGTRIREVEKERARMQSSLWAMGKHKHAFKQALTELDKRIEFEEANVSMINDGELSHISGFCPEPAVPELKHAAGKHGWALLIEEPGEGDQVPTLVKNPRWIRIIKPVFDFLGTVPGYREYDISLWFLLFFSIFFGMLIGDAGYGMFFLLLTLVVRLVARKAPPEFFILMGVTGFVTVVWGGITGTWFGSEAIARSPLVSWMIIPAIYSFKQGNTSAILMQFCFIIGTVHLSIARLQNFFRRLPSLKAFAELGWLSIIIAMYFIVLFLILQQDFNPVIVILLGGGLLLVILFSEQQGRFIKGALIGLVKLPLNILSVISTFADVVSYVRLFAVGLSALEIAKAFNGMAQNVGFQGFAIAGAVLILFFGHVLNIVLGIMAVVVHGVRLNMLEYSGQLGMEWTGKPYKPFKE